MSRRSLTLLIASAGTALAIAVSVLVPVPYVILGPGPTLNTLGKDSSGRPLITISGHASYPTTGHLNLVTVSYQGCAGNRFNIFTALVAWLNPHQAVVPESEICPAGQTQKQTQEQDTQEMTSSQSTATAAALTELHIPYSTQVVVFQPEKGFPAYGVLKAGDVINSVDGQRGTRQSGGHPVMGVQVTEQYKFPFPVKISVGDIGGPSAGMMFALGIIDKLTKLDLTAGRFIAGTGEITASGQVQPIGGIQQKMTGARNAGATIFLTPAANCADTKGAVPAGLRLVKVSTLNQAVTYLEALKSGHPNSVPSC